jgi:hypothetical protein
VGVAVWRPLDGSYTSLRSNKKHGSTEPFAYAGEGTHTVESGRLPLMRRLLPSFRRKPESSHAKGVFQSRVLRGGLLDPGFHRGDDHACGIIDGILLTSILRSSWDGGNLFGEVNGYKCPNFSLDLPLWVELKSVESTFE